MCYRIRVPHEFYLSVAPIFRSIVNTDFMEHFPKQIGFSSTAYPKRGN
jgi:hypothetical protein